MAGNEKKVSFIISAKDKASAVFGKVKSGLAGIAKGLTVGSASVVAGLTAAAVGFGAIIAKSLEFGGNLKDASDRLGIATDQLAALRYAGEQAGIGVQETDTAIKFMLKNLADLGKADAFGKLGLNMLELRQQSPAAAFADIVGALEGVDNASDRMALAMEIFGKAGGQVLTLTADGIKRATEEAYKFGIALDQATAGRLEGLGDSWDKIKAAVMGAGLSFTTALAGPLEKVAAKVEEFAASGKLKQWAEEFGRAVIGVAAVIVRTIPQALLLVLEIMGKIAMGFRGWQMLWTELRVQFADFMAFLWGGLNTLRSGITATLEALNINGVFDDQIADSKRIASEQQTILAAIKADREAQLKLQQEAIKKNNQEQTSITDVGKKIADTQKYFDEFADSLTFGDKIVEQAEKAGSALDKLQAKQRYVSLGSAGTAKSGQTVFGDEHRLRELERTE